MSGPQKGCTQVGGWDALTPIACAFCKTVFKPKSRRTLFCSRLCSARSYARESTGKTAEQRRALTADEVKDARTRFSNGARIADMANELGVPHKTLSDAVYGRTWKSLDAPITCRTKKAAEHAASQVKRREAVRLEREAFFAKRRVESTPERIVSGLSDDLTHVDLAGREIGLCKVLSRGTGGLWHCRCLACGAPFATPTHRIARGHAGTMGCGCMRKAPGKPAGPMPRNIVPLSTKGGDR